MDVYGRVARALLELAAPQAGTPDLLIQERVSRQDLAKTVGASREMVSRVIKDLEERGHLVLQDGGSILVKDHLGMLD